MAKVIQFRRRALEQLPLDEPDWREPDELCPFCFEAPCECLTGDDPTEAYRRWQP